MAAGHGGQILLAGSTAALVEGVDLADLGAHRLRDLSASEHLFQVRAPGLRTVFPALRTLDAVPGNLPVQATSFIGRESQVVQLAGLVREHRLVTLTGVGGVGKTRLALEVAAWVAEDFPDGIWLVELAAVGDPAALPDVVATTLGISVQADRSVTESITEALVGRRLLLLLDNCEHVLGAAADLVESILARNRTITIMATSREGLRVAAEHSWLVPSLSADGAGSECVALFMERAWAMNAGFSVVDPAEAEAVEVVCRRLDGIALAIELAAARMVSMSPQDVRDRLDERFRLLAGSRRGLERHQTLRHAVAGPTTCSTTPNDSYSDAARSSPAASTWPPRRAFASHWTTSRSWTRSIPWSASRWSSSSRCMATPATGCWKPSVSSPRRNWVRRRT
jgi:hypothetical protein